jgi:hypothetical protein
MLNERRGFTVREFNEACRRNVAPSSRWMFREPESRWFLDHCCISGLLTHHGGVYVPTDDLYVALDVPPPLSPSPPTGEERNGMRART